MARPTVIPASTRNGGATIMVAAVLPWAFKQFGIDMSAEVAINLGGIIVLVVMHFTVDKPSREVAQQAVDKAADKIEKEKA